MDKCKICKKEFVKKRYNQLYCSKECVKKSESIRKRKKYSERTGYIHINTKICPICGVKFKSKQHNNIYCSLKCRNKFHSSKEINKQRNKQYKQSEKYKKWKKEYYKSDKYKNHLEKMRNKSDYKQRRYEINKKYRFSEKGKLCTLKYDILRRKNMKKIKNMFTDEEYNNKLQQTKGYCNMCNKYIGCDKLTLDHIIPISKVEKNHKYYINDIQFLCKSCNSKKGTKIIK